MNIMIPKLPVAFDERGSIGGDGSSNSCWCANRVEGWWVEVEVASFFFFLSLNWFEEKVFIDKASIEFSI